MRVLRPSIYIYSFLVLYLCEINGFIDFPILILSYDITKLKQQTKTNLTAGFYAEIRLLAKIQILMNDIQQQESNV